MQFTQDDSGKVLGFCPYCGHEGRGCWWTQAQADYIGAVAGAEVVVPELKKLARDLERSTRGGLVQFKADVRSDPVPPAPIEADEPWPTKTFTCCDDPVKHDGTQEDIRCPICGKMAEA